MCWVVFSGLFCCAMGLADQAVIDPLIFKSVLILFGMTISFRNTQANQRRLQAMDHLHRLMSGFWGITVSLPRLSRARYREPLVAALKAVIEHVPTVSCRNSSWYGVVGLHPVDVLSQHGTDSIVIPSPRALLVTTLISIEEEIERIEAPPKQVLRRNFWLHKQELLNSYDSLILCTVPAVSDRYLALMDMCRFLYAAALPFGFAAQDIVLQNAWLEVRWSVPSEVMLMLLTMTVTLVLYSLESITQENEDPLQGHKEEDDLDLRHLDEVFKLSTEGFDLRCAAATDLQLACDASSPHVRHVAFSSAAADISSVVTEGSPTALPFDVPMKSVELACGLRNCASGTRPYACSSKLDYLKVPLSEEP